MFISCTLLIFVNLILCIYNVTSKDFAVDRNQIHDDALNSKLDEILTKLILINRRLNDVNSHDCPRTYQESRITETKLSEIDCKPSKFCGNAGKIEVSLPDREKPVSFLCDTNQWIVVLHRFDGSLAFHNKTWEQYKMGFGNPSPNEEFFLGLQNLHDITTSGSFQLRFEIEDFDGTKRLAHYSAFSLGDERSGFVLGPLGVYNGDAGDSFSYHVGQGFTTLDHDNDGKSIGSCGEEFNSAGWFKACMEANLFGRYMHAERTVFKEGMYWETFRGPDYSLKSIKVATRSKC